MSCLSMGGQLPPSLVPITSTTARYHMYNYIPHPSNARQSSVCVSLLIEEGFAGYGLYWAVLEVLRDAPGYRYSPDPRVWAYVLHAQDIDQVERVLTRYRLFDLDDDGLLFSPWLLEQLGSYDEQKRRRSEAGRKGAARRWASHEQEDGKAIAMPSLEDGKAIAYNATQYDVMQDNISEPTTTGVEDWREICANQGPALSADIIEALCGSQPDGHAPGYIAQVCIRYGMGSRVLDFLCELTNNAEVTNTTYKKFCVLVRRIEAEKWKPERPANFFLSKLLS